MFCHFEWLTIRQPEKSESIGETIFFIFFLFSVYFILRMCKLTFGELSGLICKKE